MLVFLYFQQSMMHLLNVTRNSYTVTLNHFGSLHQFTRHFDQSFATYHVNYFYLPTHPTYTTFSPLLTPDRTYTSKKKKQNTQMGSTIPIL